MTVQVGLTARIQKVLMELFVLIAEDVGAVMGAFQDQDLVASIPEESLGFLRMNYRKKIKVSNPLCQKLFYIGS